MTRRAKIPRLHLIVGGSHGLGSALAIDSLNNDKTVCSVSRSKAQEPSHPSIVHIKCDLGKGRDLEKLKYRLRSISKNIDQITFCQRFRPPKGVSDRDVALGTYKVETISTSEIIRAASEYKGNDKISVVISSSLNAFLVNKTLSLWYHISKISNRQLMQYFSASLESKGMYFSVIEFGSFLKPGSNLDRAKTLLLEKVKQKSISRHIPTAAEAARMINLVHQSQLNGLSGQVYSYDGGISKIAPECLLDDQ